MTVVIYTGTPSHANISWLISVNGINQFSQPMAVSICPVIRRFAKGDSGSTESKKFNMNVMNVAIRLPTITHPS